MDGKDSIFFLISLSISGFLFVAVLFLLFADVATELMSAVD